MARPTVTVCNVDGCHELATQRGRCTRHARATDKLRGTRQERGYDAEHDTERRRWARILKRQGELPCANPACKLPGQPIRHGDDWDLGHNEERTAWRGPEHPLCNRSEGGRASHERST